MLRDVSMKIKINNFQSIKSVDLEFSGFTAITGKSDLGKSAVRRAVQTALFNTWDSSYRRVDSKKTFIEITTEKDCISVVKSNTDNQFTVNGQTHYKMGKDKPNLPNYSEELNITTQLEPLFMVSYKDTENTKILNNLFGIEKIETAQQYCSKDLREVKQNLKFYNDEKEKLDSEVCEIEQEYYKLKEIDDFLTEINYIKTLITKSFGVKEIVEVMDRSKKQYEARLKVVQEILDTIQAYQKIKLYISLDSEVRELSKELKKENNTITRIDETLTKTKNNLNIFYILKNYLNLLLKIDSIKVPRSVQFSKIKGIKTLLTYIQILDKIKETTEELDEQVCNIHRIDEQIGKNEICPYCKQIIRKGDE